MPTEPAKKEVSSSGPSEVRCSHLLVKHKGSRRPSSWREDNITRSKEEARQILEGYRKEIEDGASLDELAQKYSDCSSAKVGIQPQITNLSNYFINFLFFVTAWRRFRHVWPWSNAKAI